MGGDTNGRRSDLAGSFYCTNADPVLGFAHGKKRVVIGPEPTTGYALAGCSHLASCAAFRMSGQFTTAANISGAAITCDIDASSGSHRMGKKMDRVLDALERSLARADDSTLVRGLHFPTRWDPYFHDYMMLADVYGFPGEHYDHHRRQLTLAKLV